MDQRRNRRFSTGQMKTATTKSSVIVSETDRRSDRSDVSTAYGRFRSRECPEARVMNNDKESKEATEDVNVDFFKVGSLFDPDMSRPDQSDDALFSKTLPMTTVTKRHVRAKGIAKRSPLQNERPCTDIGLTAERHRFSLEKGFIKQSQSNNKPPTSSRRMSSPEKRSNSSPSERFEASTRTVLSKRKTRLLAQIREHLDAQTVESRYSLPKIIESIGNLKTENSSESPGKEKSHEVKTTKSSSPRSFNAEKSTDQIQFGLLESKICDIVMSSLATESEGNGNGKTETPANKNKIIEISLDGKQQDIVPSRSLNLPTQTGAESPRKTKRSIDIDLVRLSATEEDFTTNSDKKKQLTQRKRVSVSPQIKRSKFRAKSKEDGASAFQEASLTKSSEQGLGLKVQAFLRSQQPMASPGTLKVTAPKIKTEPVLPNNSVRERRSDTRVFVNTDTCPSTSNLINQDRSWYYQDRKGKCRYLRVPESPVPPIEWVFQREDSL